MFSLPSTVPEGIYYVGAIVDSENVIEEPNEQNNVLYDKDRIQVEKDSI